MSWFEGFFFNAENLTWNASACRYLPFGINGMLGGAATVFFSYIGFDTVASTAEEVLF